MVGVAGRLLQTATSGRAPHLKCVAHHWANGLSCDRYFGNDQSKLLVLTNGTTVDMGKEGAVSVFGSEAADTIKTSVKLPMFVRAGDGDDIITGSSESDMLDGGAGKDRITAGAGNDFIWIDGDDTLVNGGAGLDVVIVEGYGAVTLDLFKSEVEVVYSGPGDDTITMSGGKYGVRVLAGAGADNVTTSAGDDYIDGGPGDDTIDAGQGDGDTAIFSGKFNEYKISTTKDAKGNKVVTVEDQVRDRDDGDSDGKDVLRNVERLEFEDRNLVLDGRNNAPVIGRIPRRIVRGEEPLVLDPFADLLSVAIEFDGDPMTLVGVGPATNGAVTMLPDGRVEFRADKGFQGRATLQFSIQDTLKVPCICCAWWGGQRVFAPPMSALVQCDCTPVAGAVSLSDALELIYVFDHPPAFPPTTTTPQHHNTTHTHTHTHTHTRARVFWCTRHGRQGHSCLRCCPRARQTTCLTPSGTSTTRVCRWCGRRAQQARVWPSRSTTTS